MKTFNHCLDFLMKVIGVMSMLLLVTGGEPASGQMPALESGSTTQTTITVLLNGAGTVRPDYNGKLLKVGSLIFPKVKPAPGYIWAGWTLNLYDGTHYNNTFTVEPGLELTANFVPNPFPSVQGDYQGLVFETNHVQQDHAGFFTLKLNSMGRYNGKIIIGNHTYPLGLNAIMIAAKSVAPDGRVQAWLYRGDVYGGTFHHVLTADLQFDLTNGTGQVLGTVSDAHTESRIVGGVKDWYWVPATWVAQLEGHRASFNARTNPAPQAGIHALTFVEEGTDRSGFAEVKVNSAGHVRLTGALPDGTRISQSTSISQDGYWPFFVTLYGGQGSALGWLVFSDQPDRGISGNILWLRPGSLSVLHVE